MDQRMNLEAHPTGLIVVCGATATGKSGLALALAQRLQTGILSADSRQVYREFDIGTAKPTVEEQQLVSHYLIDICSPTDTLTVAEYQQQAQALISQYHQQGQIPLLVGGTGLYIKSVVQGMKIPRVAPQPGLRSQLTALGQTQLYAFLQQVDPTAAQKIHPNLQIGLDCEPSHLTQRIAQRTEQMLAANWEAEVKTLCEKYGTDLPLLNTLGYQEMKQYLAGDISLTEAKELTILHTRQFAKRQRTWFRAYPEIVWFDAEQPDLLEKVWQRVQAFSKDLNYG
jgi:tRNA dimethylallyltransferase